MARRAEVGDQVPGYGDLSEIGSGAFATVYRATEIDTGRPVALKILKVDAVHPQLVETFKREIQTLAKVSDHPNIVTFYRPLTTPDGRPVLVLELCRESLADRLRRGGPLGARDVIRIGVKIAGALKTAHRAGFLHRDMKPQNVLVTQFGEPALGDFGVAALQASAQATAGVFGFTTLHAAPEILEGNELSPATDVYGLASTMYQALTGLAPFATFESEAPASVILRIIRDPVRPIRSQDVPIVLSDLLEAALAKQPTVRPAGAAAFAEALIGLEQANGWPTTAYVAWGEARLSAGSVPDPAGRPAVPPPPRAGPPLYPSAPSVRVAQVTPRRPMAPVDVGPVAGPDPPTSLASPPAPAAETPQRPPIRTRSGQGIAQPDEVSRNVVPPDQSGRGPEARPFPAERGSEASFAPLNLPPGASSASPRPRFLDAPSGPAGPRSARESVYEQTLLPTARMVPNRRQAGTSAVPPSLRRDVSPVLMAAVLGLAVAVVILAILLIAGVL